MSWEPDVSVGFSPCGVAFGAMQRCYSAPCRFYADDSVRTNRINWYFVANDTLRFEGRTVFTPRIDDSDAPPDLLTEPTGIRQPLRSYAGEGVNRWGTLGVHVDGDEQDFLGESPRSKYAPLGGIPASPCGLTEHDFFVVAITDLDDTFHAPVQVEHFGLCLALADDESATLVDSFGFSLGLHDPITGDTGEDSLALAIAAADRGEAVGDSLALCVGMADTAPPPAGNFILQETGDKIVLEDGSGFVLCE